MKYVVSANFPAEYMPEHENTPQQIEEWIGKWQALNPIGFYFGLTHRHITVIVDVPNEDAMFEALYATWVLGKVYPSVTPVAEASEFGSIMARIGLG